MDTSFLIKHVNQERLSSQLEQRLRQIAAGLCIGRSVLFPSGLSLCSFYFTMCMFSSLAHFFGPPTFEVDIIPIAQRNKVRPRQSHSGELQSQSRLGFESRPPHAEPTDLMMPRPWPSACQSYPVFRNRKGCWKLLSGSKMSQIPQLGQLLKHLP